MDKVEDNRCHQLGSTRLLNSIAKFSSSGGLGEATSWISLRQNIYLALVHREPIGIRLENYIESNAFNKCDDGAWANVMVHLFAKVLALAFDPQQNGSAEKWHALEGETERWNESKPDSFSPISFQAPTSGEQNIIPEIWMLNSYHGKLSPFSLKSLSFLISIFEVVGVQYYYLAKIFTSTYQPSNSSLGIGSFRNRRKVEVSDNATTTGLKNLTCGRNPCPTI